MRAITPTNSNIKRDDAVLSLRNLFEFCDWVDYSYSAEYQEKSFDESILATGDEKRVKPEELKALYIVRELQAPNYYEDETYKKQRCDLVDSLHNTVIEFNDDSFMVKRHMRYIEKFRASDSWNRLETIDISEIREHIASLATPKNLVK